MQNNNNLVTEIGVLILSVAILGTMFALLFLGKITYVEAIPFLTVVAGLYGVNTAYKVPSPTQQAQISTQQENLQNLINMLPTLFAEHTHTLPPTPPPSTPTQPVQPVVTPAPVAAPGTTIPPAAVFVPDPAVSMAAYQTGMMPAVTPPTQGAPQ